MDIPMMLQGVTWVAVDEPHCQRLADGPHLPHVTHEGAVFEKEDFERFMEAWVGQDASFAAKDHE